MSESLRFYRNLCRVVPVVFADIIVRHIVPNAIQFRDLYHSLCRFVPNVFADIVVKYMRANLWDYSMGVGKIHNHCTTICYPPRYVGGAFGPEVYGWFYFHPFTMAIRGTPLIIPDITRNISVIIRNTISGCKWERNSDEGWSDLYLYFSYARFVGSEGKYYNSAVLTDFPEAMQPFLLERLRKDIEIDECIYPPPSGIRICLNSFYSLNGFLGKGFPFLLKLSGSGFEKGNPFPWSICDWGGG